MKTAWFVLIVSAMTDFTITFATGLMTVMTATGGATVLPNRATVLVTVLGGVLAASRTIQQTLKTTPDTAQALKGGDPTITLPAVAVPLDRPVTLATAPIMVAGSSGLRITP